MKQYDYLIVGAGLFGATFAWKMTQAGKRCLVIDKRAHIGGNCYTEDRDDINIHMYGPHIFHCTNKSVWEHVNQFATFNHFTYRPKVAFKNKIYSFPINLMTLYQVFGCTTPDRAREVLARERAKVGIADPQNLEEYGLSQLGEWLYRIFIYGYTKKQWGREPRELPASILKRIPIRLTYDDNYFDDPYQGIPVGGYTPMFQKMLQGVKVFLDCDYFKDKRALDELAKKTLFTGMLDEYYDYRFGRLEYRGLKFNHVFLNGVPDWQGNAAINYTDHTVDYTRIIEHHHFQMKSVKHSWITYETPDTYAEGKIPYYPVGDAHNLHLFSMYRELADRESDTLFGGRLASYKYWDMHQTIPAALQLADRELSL